MFLITLDPLKYDSDMPKSPTSHQASGKDNAGEV